MDTQSKSPHLTKGFVELLDQSSRVSIRLSNVIRRAAAQKELPYQTIGAYLSDGELGRFRMSRLENLGRKSIAELELLIAEAALNFSQTDTSVVANNLSTAEIGIPEFLGQFCGVNPTLLAAVADASENGVLPFRTVREYVQAGDAGKEQMLIVRGISREALFEFDHLLAESGYFLSVMSRTEEGVPDSLPLPDTHSSLNTGLSNEEILGVPIVEFIERQYKKISRNLRSEIRQRNSGQAIPYETVGQYLLAEDRLERLTREYGLSQRSALEFERLVRIALKTPREGRTSIPRNENGYADVGSLMHDVLSSLHQRQQIIMALRFFEKRTLEEVASDFGITRERVRQLEASSIRKISAKHGRLLFEVADSISEQLCVGNTHELPLDEFSKLVTCEARDIAIYVSILKKIDTEKSPLGLSDDHLYLRNHFSPRKSWRSTLASEMSSSALLMNMEEAVSTIKSVPSFFIRDYFLRKWGGSPGDADATPPRYKTSYMCVDVLKRANRPLHTSDVRARIYEAFKVDVEEYAINATLGRLREAVIFAPGTYVLYRSLPYTPSQIEHIRNIALAYLIEKGVFLSSKILFEDVFAQVSDELPDLNHYVVMGILQDDRRFTTKRGNMIGLISFDLDEAYTPLQDEIVRIVLSHGPVSLQEITARVSETRRLCNDSGVRFVLAQSPEVIQIGPRTYDSLHRFFENRESYEDLLLAIRISLLDNGKTTYALSQELERLGLPKVTPQLIESLLASMKDVETENDIHVLAAVGSELAEYNDAARSVLSKSGTKEDLEKWFEDAIQKERLLEMATLDARFLPSSSSSIAVPGRTELDSILSEFGF